MIMKKYYAYCLLVLVMFLTSFSYGQNVNTSVAGNGSSTVPANAVSATVQIWGAGGAGGGSSYSNYEGSGGGGGGYSTRTLAVTSGQTINYTVGGGGNGNTGDGQNGGNTTLTHGASGTNMIARGGGGGNSNNNSNTTGGGAGGTANGGTTNTSGQNGLPNNGNGTGGNGGDGANAPNTGGNGNSNNNGGDGSVPGGGGGGGERWYYNVSGGNGANGRVIITYTIVSTPSITNFTPSPVCVGASVVITGTNFIGVTAVRFNGVNASSYTVNSATQITAVVPNTTTGLITVVTGAGTATSAGNITINSLSIAPVSISGVTTVCAGNTTTLTLNGGSAGTGATAEWFTGSCGGTPIGTGTSINVLPIAPSTTYYVRYNGTCNITNCAFTTVSVESPVTGLGIITGNQTVCQGDNGVVYTVSGISNASSYIWTVPTGASIVSGNLTNSIIVNYGTSATSGNITVAGSNSCGTQTPAFALAVTVSDLPDAAGAISGTASLCQNTNGVSFSIPPILNATGYIWTLPAGATIASGAGTENITVDFSPTAASGTLSVYCTNGCGNGSVSNFAVVVNTLSIAPTNITGTTTICEGNSTTLTVNGGTLGTGATIEWFTGSCGGTPAGSGTSINVSPIVDTDYFVRYTGTCNTTTCASVSVNVNPLPVAAGIITGTATVCQGDTAVTFSVPTITNASNYNWSVPTGATIVSGAGSSSITVDFGANAVSGNVSVYGVNGCGNGGVSNFPITVNPLPAAAGIITGSAIVCQGDTNVSFSVPTIANATGYVWSLPIGATIVSGINTESITVDFSAIATSGILTVQGTNACGVGTISANFNLTVNITPYIPINYSVSACSGEEATVLPVNGGGNIVPVGTTYSWGLPTVTGGLTGATALSGQTNFNQTLFNPTNSPQTASYLVTATTAGCSASTFAVVVTVNAKPIGSASPAVQTVCSGVGISTINFSETSGVSGTIDYSWTRDNANVGGMSTTGTGSSINGTLTNTTNIAQTTIFTVIASSEYGCQSNPFTVSVTVDPTPTVAATPASQPICSGDTITPIVPSNPNNVAGPITYSWTRNNTGNITGIANGSGTSITGALTNTTNTQQTTVFTITASANGCPSSVTTASVTVNPKPNVAVNLTTQTVCGETSIADIVVSNLNGVAGTTYSWTRTNNPQLSGIALTGTGATISGSFINTSNTNQITVFTVRATSGNCYTETTSEVIVKPTPLVVATPVSQTVCDQTTASITLSNTYNVPGTTYSWTRTNTTNITGIAASGTTSNISGTLVNNTSSTQTTTFTITATANGCSKTTTATITVYPPLVDPVIGNSQDVCNSQSPSPLFETSSVSGGSGSYTYQWQQSNNGTTGWTNIGGATNTTYNPPNNERYYRLRVTDGYCGTVLYSNTVAINYIGLGGVFDGAHTTNLPGTVCSGSAINPGVNIDHTILSSVTFTYSANSAYVTPSNGTITNTTVTPIYAWIFHIGDNTSANIPLTVQNNTNSTITTQLYISPIFDNGLGTCTSNSIAVPITIRPIPIAYASVANTTICNGTSAGVQVQGNITDTSMQFSWTRNNTGNVSGATNGTSGNIAAGNIYTINNTLTNTTTTLQTVTYTITPHSQGCDGTPITIDVNVAPNVSAGAIATDQTLCNGSDPAAFTQVSAATGLNLSYQWQISTTNGTTGFSDISGATGATYDAPGPLTQTTWYRRIAISTVNGVSCNSAPTASVQVTINNITPGSVTGNQTVCSGGDPGAFGSVAATGNGTRLYQWQTSTAGCGGSWTNITIAGNNATYNPPAGLLVTTYYRRMVSYTLNGVECTDVSNCIVVTVNDVTGGTVGSDQTICGNNPDAFTVITPSTGTGTLSYQWQISTNNVSFTDISGATNAAYDAPPGVSVVTYYRRLTTSTLNGVECSTLSNVITITPNGVTAGTIEGNRTVCAGGDPNTFTETIAATGANLTYQWQSAPTAGGPWTDITSATNATYDVPAGVTTTTYYRRIVTSTLNGNSCSATSNYLTVFVNDVMASTVAGDQLVCSTQDPVAFTVTTPASGTGTLSYQWQNSTSNSPYSWTDINLATNASYNPPVLSQTTYYQVVVTSTLNGAQCTDYSNILTVTVNPYVGAVANNLTAITNCNDTTLQLSGNATGQWSATSIPAGNSFSFSDINDPNATFTGESGVSYTITWSIDNPSPCADSVANINVSFPDCGTYIDFDSTKNNYVNVNDHYNLTSNFSIELWLKRDTNTNATETLISKRDANNLGTGYDLSLINGQVNFRWNAAGVIQSPQTLNNSRWYHVAVVYDSGTYRLYIDGIEVSLGAGTLPTTNAYNYLIGATGRVLNTPQDYFNGSMDELRIWNTALTESQIQETMNQEIENFGGTVRGSVLGINVTGLSWSSLIGYYQMNQSVDIASGQLADNTGLGNVGNLINMITMQDETAPLPYVSTQNGNWDSSSTWLNGSVQMTPNTNGVDWNIVKTQNDVSTNRPTTVLGLVVDSNRLSVINDQPLYVNKYLKINNGILDLVGESQLLQPMGSIVDPTFGTGHLERDQQGTSNLYSYNYWGSPVNTGANNYTVGGILWNGTNANSIQPIQWTNGTDANFSTNPITMSSRWIYAFSEGGEADYSDWSFKGNAGSFNVGLGFTMKGSGAGSTTQNYTFVGRPNNGTINSNTVTASASGLNQTLVGNPYPSAIDAKEFIKDNIPGGNAGTTGSIDGTLYYWEQYTTNNTHILTDYQGSYATYNLSGPLASVTPPEISNQGSSTKTPKQFIPVAQGFFVTTAAVGDQINPTIQFKNSQRVFVKETSGNSEFFRNANQYTISTDGEGDSIVDTIQRVRLAFTTPEGAKRPLLLAFTPDNAATDDFDYGYDAKNTDDLPNDMSLMIANDKYIIEGVGAFDVSKQYPIGIFLSTAGTVNIELTDLENFDSPIAVYVYDALLGTYTQINDLSFQMQLEAGDYVNRFSIVFETDDTLSTIDETFKDITVNYLQKTDEIYVKTPESIYVKQVYLINTAGQTVKSWNVTNMNFGSEFKIPVKQISEGNYILSVQTNTQTYNKKVIVKY